MAVGSVFPFVEVVEDVLRDFFVDDGASLVFAVVQGGTADSLTEVLGDGVDAFAKSQEHPKGVEVGFEGDFVDVLRTLDSEFVDVFGGEFREVSDSVFVTVTGEVAEPAFVTADGCFGFLAFGFSHIQF